MNGSMRPESGDSSPFEDPALNGTEAELFWWPEDSRAVVRAIAKRARAPDEDDAVVLRRLRCRKSVLVTPDGLQHVVLTRGDRAVQLLCKGRSVFEHRVVLTFQVEGLRGLDSGISALTRLRTIFSDSASPAKKGPSSQALRLRDNLMALDGWLAGRSYRQIAIELYGAERVEQEWRDPANFLKDRTRRCVRRGRDLMEGKYLRLLNW